MPVYRPTSSFTFDLLYYQPTEGLLAAFQVCCFLFYFHTEEFRECGYTVGFFKTCLIIWLFGFCCIRLFCSDVAMFQNINTYYSEQNVIIPDRNDSQSY